MKHPERYNEEQLRKIVLAAVNLHGSIGAYARKTECASGDISAFLNHRRFSPPRKVLEDLNLTRVILFERSEDE